MGRPANGASVRMEISFREFDSLEEGGEVEGGGRGGGGEGGGGRRERGVYCLYSTIGNNAKIRGKIAEN